VFFFFFFKITKLYESNVLGSTKLINLFVTSTLLLTSDDQVPHNTDHQNSSNNDKGDNPAREGICGAGCLIA